MNRPPTATRRHRIMLWCSLLLLAGAWRLLIAANLPAISRDGVVFCWYARDLGTRGVACLRDPDTRQHPLLPAMILAVQRTARAAGAPDSPMTWQRSGQAIAWCAGMAVVALTGLLARRLVRELRLPLDETLVAAAAMLLAAILDLHVWLSADVMSDEVHLAFYLAAACCLVRLTNATAALTCGLFAGLAFLTRPEGALPVLAGLAALWALRRHFRWPRLLSYAGLLLIGFLVCAAPYWSLVGRLSPKKDPTRWLSGEQASLRADGTPQLSYFDPGVPWASTDCPCPASHQQPPVADGTTSVPTRQLARLITRDVAWYALLPSVLLESIRAGRIIIPLLALLPILHLRRQLLSPSLAGISACATGHLVLLLALLHRYGYLHPRHTLVIVCLLTPLAAMLMVRLARLTLLGGRPIMGALVAVVLLGPLAAYSLRIPNSKDRFLVEAAEWLTAHDPGAQNRPLVGGSSTRRIAFYADMPWRQWYEEPDKYTDLVDLLRANPDGYFAIELAAADRPERPTERQGNRALLDRLLADPALAGRLRPVHVQSAPDGGELHLLALGPPPHR